MRTDDELLVEVYARADRKIRRQRVRSSLGAALVVGLIAGGLLLGRHDTDDTRVVSQPEATTTTSEKVPGLRIEVTPEHPRAGELVHIQVILVGDPVGYPPTVLVGDESGTRVGPTFGGGFKCTQEATTSSRSGPPPTRVGTITGYRYEAAGTYTLTATMQLAGPCPPRHTRTPEPLTGSTTITVLLADPATATTLPAEVHAPPTLTLTASNLHPRVGEQVTLTATVHGGMTVFGLGFAEGPGLNLPGLGAKCGDVATPADRTRSEVRTWDAPGTYTVHAQAIAGGDPCQGLGGLGLTQDLTITVRP